MTFAEWKRREREYILRKEQERIERETKSHFSFWLLVLAAMVAGVLVWVIH